jgi:hypothetical protein
MAWKGLFATLLILWVAGCANISPSQTGKGPDRYLSAELRINQTLTVPPHWARVFVQAGGVVSYSGVNQYYPFCYVELRRPTASSQEIKPGRFRVVQARQNMESVVQARPLQLAGVQIAGGGFVSDQTYLLALVLDSTEQPEVARLVCAGGFDVPALARPPTLEQINQALGDLGRLTLGEK